MSDALRPGSSDLLIAATADMAGLGVRAVGKDCDLIAEITRRPVETVAVREP